MSAYRSRCQRQETPVQHIHRQYEQHFRRDFVAGYGSCGVGIAVTNVNRIVRGCGIERIQLIACCYLDQLEEHEATYRRLFHSRVNKLRGSPRTPFPCQLKWRSATQLVRGINIPTSAVPGYYHTPFQPLRTITIPHSSHLGLSS